ncbi:MAG: SRPBCC family protein [Nocardioides sp.]
MSKNERVVQATPEQVWEILCDGWLYPLWVVGASRMREVDDSWPEVGSKLHHSVGAWPALLDDNTEVEECRPLRMLRLRARAWPTGEAEVVLRLEPVGAETRIVMEENAVSGPASLIPRPLQDPLLGWRNVEALRRLAYLCERRDQ